MIWKVPRLETTSAIFKDPTAFILPSLLIPFSLPPHPLHHHDSSSLLVLYSISNHPTPRHPIPQTEKKKTNLLMAAEKCVICLIGAMDRLWYHQIILFSEPSLFHFQENPKMAPFPAESPLCSSRNNSQVSEMSGQEISPVASVISGSQDETTSQESDYKETTSEMRPTRLNLVANKTRLFHSSSPISARKQTRNLGYSNFSAGRLQKTMSCKSLLELELEEVKGFTDLGFIFRKENMSKRMMRLIPGLQRLDSDNKNQDKETLHRFRLSSSNDDEEKRGIMRPYLSEAWVVKKPDSPLINLRIPRASTAEDMKKHLKYWARTVASAIQQES